MEGRRYSGFLFLLLAVGSACAWNLPHLKDAKVEDDDPTVQKDQLLIKAARDGDIEVVRALLSGKDEGGNTGILNSLLSWTSREEEGSFMKAWRLAIPLGYAVSGGHDEVVAELLRGGGDSNANVFGHSLLSHAALGGHSATVRVLLENGASHSAQDNDNWSPLMFAASQGHDEVLDLLLASCADHLAKGNDGKTAEEWATTKGHTAIARKLRDRTGATTPSEPELI